MKRPKQHLIDECDADVIDYIGALEAKLEGLWEGYALIEAEANKTGEAAQDTMIWLEQLIERTCR